MTIQTCIIHTMQSDMWHSNTALLDMAIADFFNCRKIPDRVVESTWFKQLLEKAKYAVSNFKAAHRKKLVVSKLEIYFSLFLLSDWTSGELLVSKLKIYFSLFLFI